MKEGLKKVVWHARFEIINRSPLVIADGGHNPEGVDGAVDSIKRYFSERVGIVTGVMADKDYRYMAGRMAEVGARAFCLTPDNPRALPADEYARVFASLGVEASAYGSVNDAVSAALEWGREYDTPIVCLGSLYMYCEVRRAMDEK